MANLGINPIGWSEAWVQALKRDDRRILGLLDKAGFKPDRATLGALGTKENAPMLARPDVRATLRAMPDRVRDAFCTPQFTVNAGNAFEPNPEVDTAVGFVRGIGVEEYRFYCGDLGKLIAALRALQREKWLMQCRQAVESGIQSLIPGFRCDFERRNGKGAAYTAAVRPEFGPELEYLASLSR